MDILKSQILIKHILIGKVSSFPILIVFFTLVFRMLFVYLIYSYHKVSRKVKLETKFDRLITLSYELIILTLKFKYLIVLQCLMALNTFSKSLKKCEIIKQNLIRHSFVFEAWTWSYCLTFLTVSDRFWS